MADVSFVSRRDTAFKEFPPASAQIALIVPFFGDLTVWIRRPDRAGWEFPSSTRRSGETIIEVAKRELWASARLVPARLDLLGAVRQEGSRPVTSYVYMCDVHNLPWSYELPEGVAEVGVFRSDPKPLLTEWMEMVLAAALRARRTGLR
ncbi:MAG: NUDIX domain-containing protein [Chloroflexi bacterium]|nr:NUDIX domain-containing protein [Chloroflexota bacterium]